MEVKIKEEHVDVAYGLLSEIEGWIDIQELTRLKILFLLARTIQAAENSIVELVNMGREGTGSG